MLGRVTRSVFSCFHRFERLFDRLTGQAGPIFVLLCTILLGLGILVFCAFMKFLGNYKTMVEDLLCDDDEQMTFITLPFSGHHTQAG